MSDTTSMALACFRRAELLLSVRQPARAEQEVRQGLTHQPNHGPGLALLARCLMRNGDFPGARDAARRAISAAPDFPYAYYCLGLAIADDRQYRVQGFVWLSPRGKQLREAQRCFEESLRLTPDQPTVLYSLAWCQLRCGRPRRALATIDRALVQSPQNVGCRNLRNAIVLGMGRSALGSECTEKTLAIAPESPEAHAQRGWVLLGHYQFSQALTHFQEAMRLAPENTGYRRAVHHALCAQYPAGRLLFRFLAWLRLVPRGVRITSMILLLGLVLACEVNVFPVLMHPFWGPRYAISARIMLLPFVLCGVPLIVLMIRGLLDAPLFFHPLGRHLLTLQQRSAVTFTVGLLGLAAWVGLASMAGLTPALCVLPAIPVVPAALTAALPAGKRRRCADVLIAAIAIFAVAVYKQRHAGWSPVLRMGTIWTLAGVLAAVFTSGLTRAPASRTGG